MRLQFELALEVACEQREYSKGINILQADYHFIY
jgi:hypothetical protein